MRRFALFVASWFVSNRDRCIAQQAPPARRPRPRGATAAPRPRICRCGRTATRSPARQRPRRLPPGADDGSPKTLPGSTGKFTLTEIRNGFGPADWHPGDHPAMPEIVARGRKDANVRACALCHYPNGKGRAENAPVSGLPVAYFVQQMHDYRNGMRKSADPKKANTNAMIAIAKGMTDEEIKASAEYFGSMKWTPWIKVVESANGAEDAHCRRIVHQPARRRDRTARPAHHRDARRQRPRGASRSALGVCRVRPGRQHQER